MYRRCRGQVGRRAAASAVRVEWCAGEDGGYQDRGLTCRKYERFKSLLQVAGVATGLEDLWRIKCEVANISSKL